GWDLDQALQAHELAKAGQYSVADSLRRFWGHVARRGSRAPCRENERTAELVSERNQSGLDRRPLVGHKAPLRPPRRRQKLLQRRLDARAAFVLVHASRGAIGDGDDTDRNISHGKRSPLETLEARASDRASAGPLIERLLKQH